MSEYIFNDELMNRGRKLKTKLVIWERNTDLFQKVE